MVSCPRAGVTSVPRERGGGTALPEGAEGKELTNERKNLRRDAWGSWVERKIISLPGLSRWQPRGGMTHYDAVVVTFFTAWA
jgi:hypothetical protein